MLTARSHFSENLYFSGFVGPVNVLDDFISNFVGFVGPVSVLVGLIICHDLLKRMPESLPDRKWQKTLVFEHFGGGGLESVV